MNNQSVVVPAVETVAVAVSKPLNVTSFIDAVLTEMMDRKSTSGKAIKRDKDGNAILKVTDAHIAKAIQAMPEVNVLNRITACAMKLANERAALKSSGRVPKIKPESVMFFLQRLQNNIAYSARRLIRAQALTEAQEQASGLDFSQDLAAQLGVESVSTLRIHEIVAHDKYLLTNCQVWMAAKVFDYMTAPEALFTYAESVSVILEDGSTQWVLAAHTDSLDEAFAIMDDSSATRQLEALAQATQEASTFDFTCGAESPAPVPVPVPSSHVVGQAYKPQAPLGASNKPVVRESWMARVTGAVFGRSAA